MKTNKRYISDHGKIIFIICKSTLHKNWCGIFYQFKAWHEFQHSVPITHTQRVTGLHNDDILSYLWGREYHFQNWTVTLPLSSIYTHIDLLNGPTEPVVRSLVFLCLLGTVLVDTGLPTVAAVQAQINWYIKT